VDQVLSVLDDDGIYVRIFLSALFEHSTFRKDSVTYESESSGILHSQM